MSKCAIVGMACPQTNDRKAKWYCPAWQEGIVWTNPVTNEQRIMNCQFEAMVHTNIEVIRVANSCGAEIESTRNEIAHGFQTLNLLAAASVSKKLLEG